MALTNELEKILLCLKNYDHSLAKFKATYMLMMISFGNFFKDKKPDIYIAGMNQILKDSAHVFGPVTELIRLGIQSYTPPKEEDIEMYKKFLQHPLPTGEGSSLLFIERFLPVIAKAGEDAWVKKFISKHFPNNIDQLRKDISVHWRRLLLLSNIYSGNYLEAAFNLQKAFSANTGKSRRLDLDFNLRCYSVFLTVMKEGPGPAFE